MCNHRRGGRGIRSRVRRILGRRGRRLVCINLFVRGAFPRKGGEEAVEAVQIGVFRKAAREGQGKREVKGRGKRQ